MNLKSCFFFVLLVGFWPLAVSAQCVPDQPVLTGVRLTSGLAINLNTSNNRTDWLSNDGSSLLMQYPSGQTWGAVFITEGPSIPPGNRPGRDLSICQNLILELSGTPGSTVEIGIKDSSQPDNGAETKIPIQLTSEWQSYSIPVSRFTRVDLRRVYVTVEFVFSGSQSQTLRVRNVRYTSTTPTTSKVLPQFAFGGGWYSALYFANKTEQPQVLQVRFIGDDGRPLQVPSLGVSSTAVNLAPRGAAIVEALNRGPLSQGYAVVELPDGVLGYGVFRQTVEGRGDQEAVVPLSSMTTAKSTMIWDDTAFTTAVALVNPGTASTIVAISVRDNSGQLIGSSTLPLSPGSKTAAALRSLPGLAAIAGKLGVAEFSVSSGRLAALGLRFGGQAFTSIPTTDE